MTDEAQADTVKLLTYMDRFLRTAAFPQKIRSRRCGS